MEVRSKCQTTVYDSRGFTGWACGRTAAFEHEGKFYCKTHYPPNVQARRKASDDRYRAEMAAQRAKAAEDRAARKEMERRAALYPAMYEALNSLVSAINYRSAAIATGSEDKREFADHKMWEAYDAARSALKYAQGEEA